MNHQNEMLKSLTGIEDNKNSPCQVQQAHKCYIRLCYIAKLTENKLQMLKMGSLRGYSLTSNKGIRIRNAKLGQVQAFIVLSKRKVYKLALLLDY